MIMYRTYWILLSYVQSALKMILLCTECTAGRSYTSCTTTTGAGWSYCGLYCKEITTQHLLTCSVPKKFLISLNMFSCKKNSLDVDYLAYLFQITLVHF